MGSGAQMRHAFPTKNRFSQPMNLHDFPFDAESPSFTVSFTAERLSNHYIIKVIAPLLMIVLLSWVAFWLNPAEGESQLEVVVTTGLAQQGKIETARWLDRVWRLLFPGLLVLGACYAFLWH
jgi:hypothetical protein